MIANYTQTAEVYSMVTNPLTLERIRIRASTNLWYFFESQLIDNECLISIPQIIVSKPFQIILHVF